MRAPDTRDSARAGAGWTWRGYRKQSEGAGPAFLPAMAWLLPPGDMQTWELVSKVSLGRGRIANLQKKE